MGQPPQQGVEGCAAWIVCESEFHSGSGAEGAAGPARTAGPVRGLGSEAVVGLVERREAQVRRGPGAAWRAGQTLGRTNRIFESNAAELRKLTRHGKGCRRDTALAR